jgi:hypothetical protein
MEKKEAKSEPAGVAELRERIETWRRTRAKPGPMPEALWRAAAQLARKHGLSAVAAALRLQYYALKDRVEGTTHAVRRQGTAAFVEVSPPAMTPSGCVLELEAPGQRKMTLRVSSAIDVVAVVDAFWRCRR